MAQEIEKENVSLYSVKAGDWVFKNFDIVKTKAINETEGTIEHCISQQIPDLDKEFVWLDGAKVSENIIVILAHGREKRGRIPLGKVLSIRIEGDGVDKAMIATTKFSFSEIPEDEESKFIFDLYRFGYLKGWSIGFEIGKILIEEEGRQFLLDNGIPAEVVVNVRRVLTDITIHEYSVAPIPANPRAVTLAHEGCLFKAKALALESELKELREEVEALKTGEMKAEWDTAYINSLPDSAFAVIEPAYKRGDTENKNARHLPHHSKGVTNGDTLDHIDMPHFRNALARLSQIKPATDSISAIDLRAKAEAHLMKHKKQLEKKDQETSNVRDVVLALVELVTRKRENTGANNADT